MKRILRSAMAGLGLALFCVPLLHAQESAVQVQREAGLQLYDLENFSLLYKWQAPSGRYRRISFLVGSASYVDTRQIAARSSVNAGIGFGLEKRSPITGNLHFYHGPEASLYLTYQIQKKGDNLLAASEPELPAGPDAWRKRLFLHQPGNVARARLQPQLFRRETAGRKRIGRHQHIDACAEFHVPLFQPKAGQKITGIQ